MTIILFSLPLA